MAKNTQLVMDLGDGLSMLVGLPVIEFWDTANRPQNPKPGTFGFNFETKSLEYWDGADWFVANMEVQ